MVAKIYASFLLDCLGFWLLDFEVLVTTIVAPTANYLKTRVRIVILLEELV